MFTDSQIVIGNSPSDRASGSDAPTDCPECGVPAAVLHDVCEVCFAELDEIAPFRLASAS
ncbi:MAG TPA: hypothetical protein VGZ50_01080 [Actinomycetota bacterium]|nr:hypothetical protein [Actinomycetota bacterium]